MARVSEFDRFYADNFDYAAVSRLFEALAVLHECGFACTNIGGEQIIYDVRYNGFRFLHLYPMKAVLPASMVVDFYLQSGFGMNQENKRQRRDTIEVRSSDLHPTLAFRPWSQIHDARLARGEASSFGLERLQSDDVFSLFMLILSRIFDSDVGRRARSRKSFATTISEFQQSSEEDYYTKLRGLFTGRPSEYTGIPIDLRRVGSILLDFPKLKVMMDHILVPADRRMSALQVSLLLKRAL